VEASKKKTHALTDAYEKSHSFPPQEPVFEIDGVALYADRRNAEQLGRHNTLDGYLKSHFGRLGAGDYAAFLAYVERDPDHIAVIGELRGFVRDQTHAATCVGFGPRFQHSTGQAYKGGPNTGVFLQITCDDAQDVDVPGHGYSFGVVKAAQARGDLEVLDERGRRTIRVHLKDVDSGLSELTRAVQQALA
jgi:transaldolase/glucose-6-phosphate isomerase